MHLSDAELDRWLAEDVPHGDLTTHSLGIGDAPARMEFTARTAMVAACTEEAARLIQRAGGTVRLHAPGGTSLDAGAPILEATGPGDALFAAWKVAQTLVEMASGIATAASAIVTAARVINPGVVVACTRKAFPGTRAVAAKAVQAGGATMHRLGLSETLLLFPEHRAFLPLDQAVARLRRSCPEKKVVVEVASLDEALLAAKAGADVIQLEKFAPAQLAECVRALAAHPVILAAAGGVNAANAAEYARAGASVLVTSAPYWAPPKDVAVTIATG